MYGETYRKENKEIKERLRHYKEKFINKKICTQIRC